MKKVVQIVTGTLQPHSLLLHGMCVTICSLEELCDEEEEEMEEGERERLTLQLPGWDGFVWERQEGKEENTSSDEGEEEDQKVVGHTQSVTSQTSPHLSSVSGVIKEDTKAEESC